MINRSEIRNKLIDYLALELSFVDFEDWLIEHAWNMHQDTEGDVQELVSDVKAAIHEYLDGLMNEDALKRKLYPFVASASATVVFGERMSILDIRPGSSVPAASPFPLSIPRPAAFVR